MADSSCLFAVVADRDFKKLANLYASNASQAILSYLNVKTRWSTESTGSRGGTCVTDVEN